MTDRELTPEEREKILFETEQIKVNIENARRKAELESKETLAKVDKINAEAEVTREALMQARYATKQMERTEAEIAADDKFNHTYYFNTSVGDTSTRALMQRLSYWSRTDPGCDIEIVFNSPGGSVIDGLALFDFIQEIRRKGHKVITRTVGMAASMAGILLQAGDERIMARESWLLIHEVATVAIGKIGEIDDEVQFVKRIQSRVLEIFAEGCARAHAANPTVCTKPFTVQQLKKNWARKDWWVSAPEALEHGLVDTVS